MSNPFTVLTANVAGQERMGFRFRKQAAYEIFRRQASDIVGFQELGLSNWEEVFGKARRDLDLVHGRCCGDIVTNSFAYRRGRFDVVTRDTFWLSADGTQSPGWDGDVRAATWAQLRDRESGRDLLFINTHLDNKGEESRIESVHLILKWARAFYGMPVLVTADSNTSIDSPRRDVWEPRHRRLPYITMLEAGFVDCWKAVHTEGPRPFTYHAFKGSAYNVFRDDAYGTYDTEWIMTRGLHPVGARLVTDEMDSVYPSDHYWMEAAVEWF